MVVGRSVFGGGGEERRVDEMSIRIDVVDEWPIKGQGIGRVGLTLPLLGWTLLSLNPYSISMEKHHCRSPLKLARQ
jgi:hypothetical protein